MSCYCNKQVGNSILFAVIHILLFTFPKTVNLSDTILLTKVTIVSSFYDIYIINNGLRLQDYSNIRSVKTETKTKTVLLA